MTKREKSNIAKRFIIYLVLCFPFLLGINFLIEGKVSRFLYILIDIVVGGAIIFLLEVLYQKRQQKIELYKQNLKQSNDKK